MTSVETIYQYAGASGFAGRGDRDVLALAPNVRRDPVALRARVLAPVPFRDALLALHSVVHSELYVSAREIEERSRDPVVTVTPSGVFFEAFSLDESTYGRVVVRPAALEGLRDTSYGSTNVDFSDQLAKGLREIRSTRPTWLEVAREGIAVETPGRVDRELKVKLPGSWMRGFVEVQSALRLEGHGLELAPIDLRNVLTYLRGRKEKESPRGLVFDLEPGKPPRVTVQPWDKTFNLGKSKHDAREPVSIKLWGRRRLLLLEAALPHAKTVRARLLGTGLPSFWTCELGAISFLLATSPWTAREWTGDEAFRLLAPPADVSAKDRQRVLALLEERFALAPEDAARTLRLSLAVVEAALDQLALAGRALFDPVTSRFHARRAFLELPEEPPASESRSREAEQLAAKGHVEDLVATEADGARALRAVVRGRGGRYRVACELEPSGRLRAGTCECPFFARSGFRLGPCKHLLAVRLAAEKR